MSLLEKLESNFIPEPNSGCWIWTAGWFNTTGYGAVSIGSKTIGAHRAAYEVYVGAIPKGMCVLHRCDQRLCVNPKHLWIGTHADNAADRQRKGRGGRSFGGRNGMRLHPESAPSGSRNGQARLTEENVLSMRAEVGKTHARLAAEYRVSPALVGLILSRKRWRHI